MKATRAESRAPSAYDRGFTLIELLMVVTIVIVLIGLLLPAVQKVRETVNRELAAASLGDIATALHVYHNADDSKPPLNNLSDLVEFCGARPDCLIDPELADGEQHGYRFEIYEFPGAYAQRFDGVAEPAYPGVDGDITLRLLRDGSIEEIPTPGSDQRRDAMLAAIERAAADAVGEMLLAEPAAITAIHDSSPDVPDAGPVFRDLDCDGDSILSLGDLSMANNACLARQVGVVEGLPGTVAQFFEVLAAELKIGAADEDPGRATIPSSLASGDVHDLYFNHSTLKTTLKIYTCPSRVLGSCSAAPAADALLDAAARAAARGNGAKEKQLLDTLRRFLEADAPDRITLWNVRVVEALIKTFQIISAGPD